MSPSSPARFALPGPAPLPAARGPEPLPRLPLRAERWTGARFAVRARALFYARLLVLTAGLALLAVPGAPSHSGHAQALGLAAYLFVLSYSLVQARALAYERLARTVTYLTLCADLALLMGLGVLAHSGGHERLHHALGAAQLLYTLLFALLFPSPSAAAPALLGPLLGFVLTLGRGPPLGQGELLSIGWYSALNVMVLSVALFLSRREAEAQEAIVRLEERLANAAVTEERHRLAREVHDGVGAGLSALVLGLESLQAHTPAPPLGQPLESLRRSAEECMDELRRSVRAMREDFALGREAESLVDTFAARARLRIHLEQQGRGADSVPGEPALTAFRVLQESLSNVVQHARAAGVHVLLRCEAEALELQVRDDGVGFDPEAARPGHYGLLHMQERAVQRGGTLSVTSAPGRGTSVSLLLPIRDDCVRGTGR